MKWINFLLLYSNLNLLLIGKVLGNSEIRFGHFIGRTTKANSLNIQTAGKSPFQVNSLDVTDYDTYDGYDVNFSVTVQGGQTFSITVPTNVTHYRKTVYFYWSNGPKTGFLNDIINPKSKFNKISSEYKKVRPYHNNMLIRFVAIDPQERNVTFSVKQVLPDDVPYQVLPKSGVSDDYLIDSNYAPKNFKVTSKDGLQKEFKIATVFRLHSVSTVFWYGDSISDSSIKIVSDTDKKVRGFFLPCVFLVAYIMAWGVFRSLYLKLVDRQAKKKNFYVPKTIRVQTALEKENSLTAEEVPYIDTFRGLSIILFIFVKSGGGNYWFFNESLWSGLTFGDLPKFLISWIMGFCIPLGLSKNNFESKTKAVKALLLKSSIVFILGRASSCRLSVQQEPVHGLSQNNGLHAETCDIANASELGPYYPTAVEKCKEETTTGVDQGLPVSLVSDRECLAHFLDQRSYMRSWLYWTRIYRQWRSKELSRRC